MSLHRIMQLEQRNIRIVKNKLEAIYQKNEIICFFCKKIKINEAKILINMQHEAEQKIIGICLKCNQKRNDIDQYSSANFSSIIGLMEILSMKNIRSLASANIRGIINNLYSMKDRQKTRKQCLINEVKDKLLGFDDIDIVFQKCMQLQNPNQNIHQFCQQLNKSKAAQQYLYYSNSNRQYLKLDKRLQDYFKKYVQTQIRYKLELVKDIQAISGGIKEFQKCQLYIRKALEAIDHFGFGFQKNQQLARFVTYSICRKSIQYKLVYFSQEEQENYIPIVKLQAPFCGKPITFKIMGYGLVDDVELGFYFMKKSQPFQEAGPPFLVRLKIKSEVACQQLDDQIQDNLIEKGEKIQQCLIKANNWSNDSSMDNSKHSRTLSIKKIQKNIDQKLSPSLKNMKQEIQILDEDYISLILNQTEDLLIVKNKTTNKIITEKKLNRFGGKSTIIFPCVRLIGTNYVIQHIVE